MYLSFIGFYNEQLHHSCTRIIIWLSSSAIVCLYDEERKLVGEAEVMFPWSLKERLRLLHIETNKKDERDGVCIIRIDQTLGRVEGY